MTLPAPSKQQSRSSDRRRIKPIHLRIIPVVGALALAIWLHHSYSPRTVELALSLPEDFWGEEESEARSGMGIEVRVYRSENQREVAQARRNLPQPASSAIVQLRIPLGEYRLQAWSLARERPTSAEGFFRFEGQDFLEIELR